ncbi:MAG TPA: hypothetical protein VKM93_19170 [Terriglobia bacterium]|nr:hypothetical protein [Terriglobia bacterium]
MTPKTGSTGRDVILEKAFYMSATCTIDEGGSITFETHTFNHMKAIGFHGTAFANFKDIKGNSIYSAVAGPYGVDGTWIGKSDRWDTVHYQADPNIYLKTDTIDVWVGETPVNTFLPWVYSHLGDIISILVAIFGSSSSGAEGSGAPVETATTGLTALNPALPSPTLVSPPNGQHLSDPNNKITLEWKPVAGATSYLVEAQYTNPGPIGPTTTWGWAERTNVASTKLTFVFVGSQPGRWRVTAFDQSGAHQPSPPSPWWIFDLTVSAKPALATPALLTPQEGQTFSNFPRSTTVTWRPVTSATQYRVEVQYAYLTQQGTVWSGEYNEVIAGTAYKFNFVGAQPGRCRVTALDSSGGHLPSQPSAWRDFVYTV